MRKSTLLITLVLFLTLVGFAVTYMIVKWQEVGYSRNDFSYYMQFSARLGDLSLSDRYALSPRGYNVPGLYGLDGQKGLHQGIHFEPIKYSWALDYFIHITA